MRPLLFSLLLAATLTVHGAEVYKWTDAEGKVHYGDLPPKQPAQQEKRVSVPGSSATSSSGASSGLRPGEVEMLREIQQREQAQQQEQQRQERERQAEQEKTAQANCEQYTRWLESLDSRSEARQLARQQRANGDHWTYKQLRDMSGVRRVRREYEQKVKEYCK